MLLTPVHGKLAAGVVVPLVHLELQISLQILEKKNWNDPNAIIRGLGKMIHEKNQKQKILWHYPFKLLGSGQTQLRCSPLFH